MRQEVAPLVTGHKMELGRTQEHTTSCILEAVRRSRDMTRSDQSARAVAAGFPVHPAQCTPWITGIFNDESRAILAPRLGPRLQRM